MRGLPAREKIDNDSLRAQRQATPSPTKRIGRILLSLTALLAGFYVLVGPLIGIEIPRTRPIHTGADSSPSRCPDVYCTYGSKSTYTMEFKDISSFSFHQIIQDTVDQSSRSDYAQLHTRGEVHVKAWNQPSAQKSIRVETQVCSHDPGLVNIKTTQNSMTMIVPSRASTKDLLTDGTHTEPRVYIMATVWIPRGFGLSSFGIHVGSLSIIFDSTPFPAHTPITVSAPAGSVHLSSPRQSVSSLTIDSLNTDITTQSGSVTGDFTLRDTLSIHTCSGSININLSLQDDTNATNPATLDLKATSGSIRVATTTISTPAKIPHRDYRSSLHTNSGSIRATLVHGSTTLLHTDSSSIHASLYPHGNPTLRSDLTTRAISGSTDITVFPSLTKPTAPLKKFHASCTCISGSIRLQYPGQWEGTVKGST
ncbi:MAG: hypothetical protein Q9181_004010, partial [Wetmoreana brouardii]